MPGIGPAPVGPMAMKDVGDLQPRAAHGRRATLRGSRPPCAQRRESVERLVTIRIVVSATRCKARGVELGMAEQHLDQRDVGILFQQVRGEAVPQRVRRNIAS